MSKLGCCLRRAESHRVKSQAPVAASLRQVFFRLISLSGRGGSTQTHNVEKVKDKRHHVGDKCKQMHSDLPENDPANASSSGNRVGD